MFENKKINRQILYSHRFIFYVFSLVLLILRFIVGCAAPYYYKVKGSKIKLSGTPLPFLETRITVENDEIFYSGNYEFSKTGDYQNGVWQTQLSNVSYSF